MGMNKYNTTTKIYLITNCYNNSNKIYIGKTKNCRKNKHEKLFGNNIIYSYIDEINSLNKKDWKPLECYWIEQFKAWGFDVLNKNGGGGGVVTHSNISKQLISKSLLGKKHTLETIEKQKKSLLGRKVTWGNKISKGKKGKSVPKPVDFNKGRKITWKYKISDSLLGKKKTNIHKQNMSTPIVQYDLQGNFIKEWSSVKSLLESKIVSHGVLLRNIKGQPNKSKFNWKYG